LLHISYIDWLTTMDRISYIDWLTTMDRYPIRLFFAGVIFLFWAAMVCMGMGRIFLSDEQTRMEREHEEERRSLTRAAERVSPRVLRTVVLQLITRGIVAIPPDVLQLITRGIVAIPRDDVQRNIIEISTRVQRSQRCRRCSKKACRISVSLRKIPDSRDDTDNEEIACRICLTTKANVATSCGHLYCKQCVQRLGHAFACPTCKQPVTHITRMFFR